MRGIVIARGKRFHGRKPAYTHGGYGSFRAAADHHFRGATLDNFEGVANGMGRSGACGSSRGVRPLSPIADGNMAGSEVYDSRGNKERRDAARAALHQFNVFALNDVETTDAG